MCVALAQWHGACANFSDGVRRVLHLGFCCPVSRPQHEVSSTLSDEFREAIPNRLPLVLPDDMDVQPIDDAETLNDLMLAGALDAMISPMTPQAFTDGDSRIHRLFDDPPLFVGEFSVQVGANQFVGKFWIGFRHRSQICHSPATPCGLTVRPRG